VRVSQAVGLFAIIIRIIIIIIMIPIIPIIK